MPVVNLGRIGFVNKGNYLGGVTPYKVNDIVKYNNSVYVCIQAHSVSHLPTDILYWQVWVDTANYYVKSEVDALVATDVGVPIASASTTSIGGLTAGDVIHITGVTTINSLGVSVTGTIRTLVFDDVLTLTHNATSLIMPGGADALTVAGSIGTFVCENGALGYWRCINLTHSAVSMAELLYISTLTSDAQTQLNGKAPIASPVFTGNVTGLGVSTGTSFNGITALASVAPVMDGASAIGTSTTAARQDHIHPSDTSKANQATTYTKTETDTADNLRLLLSGGTMTGAITALRETKVAMGANDINLASGNLFTKTIAGATTLTVSNWLASGNANSFILELTNGGSAVVTWFAGVKWAGGTAPTLTASGVDILGFYSHDGGTTVRGIVLAKDSK